MNPILKNELKLSARTSRITFILTVVNTILACFGIFSLINLVENSTVIDFSQMIKLYILLAYVEFGIMLLMIPTITASSISGERERQTLDILLTTKIKPWDIVCGKLAASLSSVLILSISSLPILALVYIYGGLQLIDLFALIFFLMLSAVFIGSIGILLSVLIKRTTFAIITSFITVIGVIVGSYVAVLGYYHLLWLKAIDKPIYVDPDVGNVIYVLLINPLVTFYGLINNQVGNSNAVIAFCNIYGSYTNDFVIQHWLFFGMVIQFLLSFLFLWIASLKINPLHKCHPY